MVRTRPLTLIAASIFLASTVAVATDRPDAESAPPTTAPVQDPEPAAEDDGLDREKLEAEFKRTMTGARLRGSFTQRDRPDAGPQEDSYTIESVEKLEGDKWRFTAQVEYGGRSFKVPMVLEVKWAGDTPVITLTDLKIPLVGTFTSRVLIYRGQYAGTWDGGGDHGGHMWGVIERADAEGAETEPDDDDGADDGGSDDDDGFRDDSSDGGGTDADGFRDVRGDAESAHAWPSFRGGDAKGFADGFETATEWDVEEGKNVRWKTFIPGLSHASPVIWGDRLFVVSAAKADEAELKVGLYGSIMPVDDDSEHELDLYCIDKNTGDVLWRKTAFRGVPKIKRHPKGSHAAPSPATDGKHVVAFFGSEGLHCYDVEGNHLWSKDFGVLDSGYFMVKDAQWGFSSSPVIHDGKVIVQCDVQDQSFVAALDVATGDELWRTDREEVPTFGCPTVDVREGRSQVILNGWKHIGAYDLETGDELWKLVGGGDIPVPTPVVAHDLIFITNAHGGQAPIYAIPAMAEGEITAESMPWSTRARGNYMQTPIVVGDYLYCCSDAGVLTCYVATTGEEKYRERLGGGRTGFTASCVAADGKLYVTSEEGQIHVVKLGPEFEVLAVNDMGETCMATPAISEGVLYWRARNHLFAIGG